MRKLLEMLKPLWKEVFRMAKTYLKNNNGSYSLAFYKSKIFYLILGILSFVVSILVKKILVILKFDNYLISLMPLIIASLVAGWIIYFIFFIFFEIKKVGSFSRFYDLKIIENSITKALLATMTVDKNKDQPSIRVPSVSVTQSKQTLGVKIEKLAGMYEIDKMVEDINSSLRNKFSKFNVTSSRISDDHNYFEFQLENVAFDKTLRPATLNDLKVKSHYLKLQKGLKINLADNPHLIIWGKSGSGKTTLLFSILIQLLIAGSDVRLVDGKDEFSSFGVFYPQDKIASDVEDIFKVLNEIISIISQRQKFVAGKVKKLNKFGLRAFDLGLKPVVLVADEIGSLVAGMDSKQKKEFNSMLVQIVQKGRSVSVFAILATQSPKADILPTEIRSQFSTRILLGSTSGDNQRMAFDGESLIVGDVEKFTGYFMSDGKTNQPMKFYVPDLHSYKLNDLNVLKKAYEIGLK